MIQMRITGLHAVLKRHTRRACYAAVAVSGLMTGILGESGVGGAAVQQTDAVTAADTVQADNSLFPDVAEEDWFYPYVTQLAADGYVKGRETGLYDPQGKLTVAEAATMVVRYLGLEKQAEERASRLASHKRAGSDMWYIGYIQIIYEAGLFSPEEYKFAEKDGEIVLNERSRFGENITREQFARLVTGSFALDETVLRTETPLDPGRLGHGFNTDYTYNETTADAYAAVIADFEDIPEDAREAVLRAYMNGIFQGDHEGNFNPASELTRAEMAKVISVILHKDMRTWAEVTLPVIAEEPEEPTPADPELPPQSVEIGEEPTSEQIDAILAAEYRGISVSEKRDGTSEVIFNAQHTVPDGYRLKLYHFVGSGSGMDTDLAESVNNDGSHYYRCTLFGGDRIVLALEKADTGETIGTMLLQLDKSGKLTDITKPYRP